MSVETTLYATLSSAAGVTALVSTRIYPDVMPEGVAFPAVVFSRSGTDPINGISGAKFGATVEMAVATWGKTRTSADAVADAIEAAIPPSGFYLSGRASAYDPETGLFATTLSLSFFDV